MTNDLKSVTKVKPITPQEIPDKMDIPSQVISIVNRLIAGNWNGKKATFSKDLLIELMADSGMNTAYIGNTLLYSIIELYGRAGWDATKEGEWLIFIPEGEVGW